MATQSSSLRSVPPAYESRVALVQAVGANGEVPGSDDLDAGAKRVLHGRRCPKTKANCVKDIDCGHGESMEFVLVFCGGGGSTERDCNKVSALMCRFIRYGVSACHRIGGRGLPGKRF